MTKQEKIQEAYGEHWEAVKDCVDENGYWKGSQNYDETHKSNEIIYKKLRRKRMFKDCGDWGVYKIIPKSLQGIETNNGWIKIESEDDLPKKEGSYWIYDGINVTTAFFNFGSKFQLVMGINCKATHYQPITKPQPPIY